MTISQVSRKTGKYHDFSIPKTGLSVPNWGTIPHKGMQRLSDEEFEDKIDSLGKALAAARNNPQQYETIRTQADQLMAQYVSVASPDRQALVKDTLNFYNDASQFFKRKKSSGEPLTLFDYMHRKNATLKSAEDGQFSIELSTGTTITFVGSVQQPNMLEIKGKGSDQTVISYSNGRWIYENTPQERAMEMSFSSQINKAEEHYLAVSANTSTQTLQSKRQIDFTV